MLYKELSVEERNIFDDIVFRNKSKEIFEFVVRNYEVNNLLKILKMYLLGTRHEKMVALL